MLHAPRGNTATLQQPAAAQRVCRGCVPGLFRRVNRGTLLQRTVFTWLGLFPWECVSCRRKRLFRDPG